MWQPNIKLETATYAGSGVAPSAYACKDPPGMKACPGHLSAETEGFVDVDVHYMKTRPSGARKAESGSGPNGLKSYGLIRNI